jgi:ABC-type uncharacterized transport system permease subunit
VDSPASLFLDTALWIAALRMATPFILGTAGELLCERAGVLNLGIEGIMTMGAFVGWLTVFLGGPLWLGVAAAALAGLLMGSLHGLLTVILGLSQHVVGIAISLLGVSLSSFLFRSVAPNAANTKIQAFGPVDLPLLAQIPVIGPVLAAQSAMCFLALGLLAAIAWMLYQTPAGLALRMVGESPQAAAAQGIPVLGTRMVAVGAGSMLMGVGGAYLSLSAFDTFVINLVGGRGWMCIALVVFASWKPGRALLGALFFALVDAAQLRLQQLAPSTPYQLFLMLPYVLSIVMLIGLSRRARAPQALMLAFRHGER